MSDLLTKINRWHSPYEYTTDADGVEWMHRKDANGGLCGTPIKANDPNFVQGKVPTPSFTLFDRKFDSLLTIAALLVLVIVLMLGSMI